MNAEGLTQGTHLLMSMPPKWSEGGFTNPSFPISFVLSHMLLIRRGDLVVSAFRRRLYKNLSWREPLLPFFYPA